MRIIERNPGGKEGIIEVTKEDYEESLRKHPHPGCECHVKPGRYRFRRGGFTPEQRRAFREEWERKRNLFENDNAPGIPQ